MGLRWEGGLGLGKFNITGLFLPTLPFVPLLSVSGLPTCAKFTDAIFI